MAGLTQTYIEQNLIARLAETQRRLDALERGPAPESAAGMTLRDQLTGDLYEIVLYIEDGKARLSARPLAVDAGAAMTAEATAT